MNLQQATEIEKENESLESDAESNYQRSHKQHLLSGHVTTSAASGHITIETTR